MFQVSGAIVASLVFGAMVIYNRCLHNLGLFRQWILYQVSSMGRPLYISTSQGSNEFIFILCSKACSAALILYNHQLTHNGLIYYSE